MCIPLTTDEKLQKQQTSNHNSNLQKTFDFARMEHPDVGPMLFVDIDELLLCPLNASSLATQEAFHQHIMKHAQSRQVGEVNFLRKQYGSKDNVDETVLAACLQKGYVERSVFHLLNCFGSQFVTIPLPKSADISSACPFHYDHFSCMGGYV